MLMFVVNCYWCVQVPAKGKGKGKGAKKQMKRSFSAVALDDVVTPSPAAKEAPGSDPGQKKPRGPRKGAQKGKAKEVADGEKPDKHKAAEELADGEKQDKDEAAEELADGEKQDKDEAAEELEDGEKQDEDETAEEIANAEKQDEVSAAEEVANGEKQNKAVKPAGAGKTRSKKPMTPEQLAIRQAAMQKSRAIADKNLVVIRSLASKHPELQPQVGFTAKRPGVIGFLIWARAVHK